MLLFLFIGLTVIGFMIKLPRIFRGIDKEMHALFYFTAAAFLNILFTKKKTLIFVSLVVFGVFIEYAQQYSNKILGRTIHGRFDPEDVLANLMGLIVFYILLFIFSLFKK